MATILILYSSTDGHTLKICQRIGQWLDAAGQTVTLKPLDTAQAQDLQACDRFVIGAAIRYGKHRPEVVAFITRHHAVLQSRPGGFFSVNLVARQAEKAKVEHNPYLQRFLRGLIWQPDWLAVFAGKLDYSRYRWHDRLMIRLIMWMTGGPTNPATVREYTDWRQVEAFAAQLLEAENSERSARADSSRNGDTVAATALGT